MQIHIVRGALPLVLAAALASTTSAPIGAQGPPTAPYRPPVIALVQPSAGASVPSDKPIVVFRFAPSDSSDPIDARSFAIAVDGEDRTALFQVTTTEAWGSLVPAPIEGSGAAPVGVRQVAARICSIRGACVEVSERVTLVASQAAVTDAPLDRKRSLLDLVLLALRKLIEP